MNTQCPQCGSTEFKKLSLVHAEGSSNLEARSHAWGILAGTGGGDVAFGKIRTKGEIQTKLSQQVSPPRKWSYSAIVCWGVVGLFILVFSVGYTDTFLLRGKNFTLQLAWFEYPYLCFLVFILCFSVWYNFRVFPERYRLWDRSFMCRHCGYVAQLSQADEPTAGTSIRGVQP